MTTPDTPQPPKPAKRAALPERFESLDKLEIWWMRIGVAMLIVFVVIVMGDALRNSTKHSHGGISIPPAELTTTAPFDKPGVYRNDDGSYDAVVIAYSFGFQPKEDLVVPVDTPVHFKVASLDVVHGFQIPGDSNVNLMVVPGHVSQVTQSFSTPGRHIVLCHEYCGSGHHFMTTHIRVLKKGEDVENPPALKAAAADEDAEHGDHA